MYFVKASYLVFELTILILKCQHQIMVKTMFHKHEKVIQCKDLYG